MNNRNSKKTRAICSSYSRRKEIEKMYKEKIDAMRNQNWSATKKKPTTVTNYSMHLIL